jgi:4-amino-4-deoxychorismate mutase
MTGLEPFRTRLDAIDDQIVRLLAQRFDVCRAIAEHKRHNDIPMMQGDRVAEVRERYLRSGAALGVPAAFTARFFELLIGATCDMEDELIEASPTIVEEPRT